MTTFAEKPIKNNPTDSEILRQAIIAEYDAINLYEQLSQSTSNKKLKELLLDIGKEEKVHVGELEGMLDSVDKEHKPSVIDGKKEAKSKFSEWIVKHQKI
jgi:rubrerythrin